MLVLPIILPSNNIYAEEKIVAIPKGAGDPSFDPQIKDRPAEWYVPTALNVKVGDTVTWINEDTTKHTVTSGKSSGRFGFVEGKLGEPDGIFDSGLFDAGERWSYTFDEAGTFTYFCTIHPWMSGMVVVEQIIPDYPHDADGNKVTFPIMTLSSDKKYHLGLYWSPPVIRTGEQVIFTGDFFDSSGANKQHLLKYEFVLIQNGKEIHRSSGYSERGSDIKYFVFSEVGTVTIRFENIGDAKNYAEFGTLVYAGKSEMPSDAIISSNKMDLLITQVSTYAPLIGIVGALGAIAIYYRRNWTH